MGWWVIYLILRPWRGGGLSRIHSSQFVSQIINSNKGHHICDHLVFIILQHSSLASSCTSWIRIPPGIQSRQDKLLGVTNWDCRENEYEMPDANCTLCSGGSCWSCEAETQLFPIWRWISRAFCEWLIAILMQKRKGGDQCHNNNRTTCAFQV